MKRIIRFFTFIGGVGAIAWLLRDRLVSVTTSREPEPPRFIPEPPRTPSPSQDDLTEIKGIGPTYAERLTAHGITSFARLATADAADLATKIEVPVTRVAGWIEQATSTEY